MAEVSNKVEGLGVKQMEFVNKSNLQFNDISSEEYRQYTFAGGIVRITAPQWLSVSAHGHRVWDASGVSHYVPLGWIHLEWKAKEGQPHFVL